MEFDIKSSQQTTGYTEVDVSCIKQEITPLTQTGKLRKKLAHTHINAQMLFSVRFVVCGADTHTHKRTNQLVFVPFCIGVCVCVCVCVCVQLLVS